MKWDEMDGRARDYFLAVTVTCEHIWAYRQWGTLPVRVCVCCLRLEHYVLTVLAGSGTINDYRFYLALAAADSGDPTIPPEGGINEGGSDPDWCET